jgi:hypothetical protein
MKKVLAILTLLVLTLAFASSGYAVCDQARLKVVRSEGPVGSVPGGFVTYDFAPPTVLPTFYYRFQTTDPDMIDRLNAAWVGRLTVRVVGNAASCPAAGLTRFGGTITFLFVDSFF